MTDKAFVEITNICNLNCSFCIGHKRKSEYMPPEKFRNVLKKLDNKVKYLYLHLMGEPMTHPKLDEILKIADSFNFRVMLTTNGTLLREKGELLINSKKLYKVSISLHAYEGNDSTGKLDDYLDSAIDFARKSASSGIITVFRLWNNGGKDKLNGYIIDRLHKFSEDSGSTVTPNRSGERLCDKVFIEWGNKFDWPDENVEITDCEENLFCYALRDQFGVLVDGSVVPCCLDHDGAITLGNIFENDLDTILGGERARRLYDSFTNHRAAEKLCQSCEHARWYRKK